MLGKHKVGIIIITPAPPFSPKKNKYPTIRQWQNKILKATNMTAHTSHSHNNAYDNKRKALKKS